MNLQLERDTMGKATRLLEIRLPVRDVRRSARWYEEHFGLRKVDRAPGGDAEISLAVVNGDDVITPYLVLVESDSGHRLTYRRFGKTCSVIMMHASNLEGLYTKMAAAGASVTAMHSDEPGDGCGRFFEAVDPDGHVIQIQANIGELPAPEARVEAIFNLEIPVRNVKRAAAFYVGVLGFNPVREPDDELAIVKVGEFYEERFGYSNVQDVGFFLFRHDEITPLHFTRDGRYEQCLVLQTDDVPALHGALREAGYRTSEIEPEASRDGVKSGSFTAVDPDGNRVRVTGGAPERKALTAS